MSSKNPLSTPYHEAGHAVMYFVRNRAFKYVTIVPNEESNSLGHVMPRKKVNFERWAEWIELGNPWNDSRLRRELEGLIMIYMAGPIAEELAGFDVDDRETYYGTDDHIALDFAFRMCMPREAYAFLDWLWEHTKSELGEPGNWTAVKSIADALMKKRTIKYKDVKEIYQAAISPENISSWPEPSWFEEEKRT